MAMEKGNAYRSAVIDALRKDGWAVGQGTAHGGMGVELILSRKSPETGRTFTVPLALHEKLRNLDANDPVTWLDAAKETSEQDTVFWSGGTHRNSLVHVKGDMERFKAEHLSRLYGLVGEALAAVERAHGVPLVRDWYTEAYPEDVLGMEISPSLSFEQALDAVQLGGGFYDSLGVGDSIVRERVFAELSDRACIPYEAVYDAWVNGEPLSAHPTWVTREMVREAIEQNLIRIEPEDDVSLVVAIGDNWFYAEAPEGECADLLGSDALADVVYATLRDLSENPELYADELDYYSGVLRENAVLGETRGKEPTKAVSLKEEAAHARSASDALSDSQPHNAPGLSEPWKGGDAL